MQSVQVHSLGRELDPTCTNWRCHMLQQRSKIPSVTAETQLLLLNRFSRVRLYETQHNQINKNKFKKINKSLRSYCILTLLSHSICPPCPNCLNSSLFHAPPCPSPPLPHPWQKWPPYLNRSRYSATPFHQTSRKHLDPYQALINRPQGSIEDHSPPRVLLPFPVTPRCLCS